jgi:hypothetical protein
MGSRKTEGVNRCVGLTLSSHLLEAGILILALALRLWGIGFGFPYTYHFDEPTFVRTALNLGAGIIGGQPSTTGFPNILFCEYVVYFTVGRAWGLFASAAEIKQAWQADPSVFFILLGRLTSGFLGVLSVLVTYWLGRETCGRVAGWLAALLLAVAFLHVRHSHYAVPDITVAFLTSLAVLFSMLAMQRRNRKYLYLAGATAGYAIATKWTVGPVIIPLVMATFCGLRGSQSGIGHWALAIGSFLGGFLAGGFQLVLKPAFYLDYALYEWQAGRAGGFWIWQVDTVPGWLFYLKTLNYGLGTLLLGLALVGFLRRLVMAVHVRDRMSILLLSFPLLYFLPMSSTRHYFARYALPLVPFCALFGTEAVMAISARVGARRAGGGWSLTAVLVVLVIAATAQPLSWSVKHGVILARQDTRTLAKQWIEANIPAGAKIAMDWPVYGPPLSREVYRVDEVWGAGLSRHPIEWYREEDFDYLVASSFIYNIPLLDNDLDDRRQAFYATLDRELEVVQEFRPGKGDVEPPFIFDEIYGPTIGLWQRKRPGPVIKIYRLRKTYPQKFQESPILH